MSRPVRSFQEGDFFLDSELSKEVAKNTVCRRGQTGIDIDYEGCRIVTHYSGGQYRLYPQLQNMATLWRMNIFTPLGHDILPCEDDGTIWEIFTPLDSARLTRGIIIGIGGDLQQAKKLAYDRHRFSFFLRR